MGTGRSGRGSPQLLAAPQSRTLTTTSPSGENTTPPASAITTSWIEWMDKCGMGSMDIDLFGCDENCSASRNVLQMGAASLRKLHGPGGPLAACAPGVVGDKSIMDLHDTDYAALHDEFLESLLHEQTQESLKAAAAAQSDILNINTSITSASERIEEEEPAEHDVVEENEEEVFGANTIIDNGTAAAEGEGVEPRQPPHVFLSKNKKRGNNSPSPRKRRRSIRLSGIGKVTGGRIGSSNKENRSNNNASNNIGKNSNEKRLIPLNDSMRTNETSIRSSMEKNQSTSFTSSAQLLLNNSLSTGTSASLHELAKDSYEDPSTFVHPQCRMQKDKGKGEDIGSCICAKGRDACLGKLRAKIRILTDIVNDPIKGPSSTMKRRKAKVSEELENFTETRSLIELTMGWFSMTYGVLLRWDTSRTGKITLVVLRKMCHESFYSTKRRNKSSANARAFERQQQRLLSSLPPRQPLSNVTDVVGSNNAILQRNDGSAEVTLLEPPYKVPRPETFEPSTLHAQVLFANGLARRSNWTVKLTYDGQSENILLTWDNAKQGLIPKLGGPLNLIVSSVKLSSLEIKLYEHRLRRRYRRHIMTMNVPLSSLEPQPRLRATPVRLAVPCKHNEEASIALALTLKSDYGHWVNQELEMRRRDEELGLQRYWRNTFNISDLGISSSNDEDECRDDYEDDDYSSTWDWLFCSVC